MTGARLLGPNMGKPKGEKVDSLWTGYTLLEAFLCPRP